MTRRDYLVCIDSDGCAMDTMNSKHMQCFGPAMIEVWKMEERQAEIQKYWNRINLFSGTRGINRYLALSMVLEKKGQGCDLEGFSQFQKWTNETKELSTDSLKHWIEQEENKNSECCRKAYQWTLLVNQKIEKMPKNGNQVFRGVREALQEIHQQADVAVVSSANRNAVEEEWKQEGLLEYVNVLMTQEDGSKAACISKLLKEGYPQNHVMMVGDAPGDLKAARENGVLYFPILANQEEASWNRLRTKVFEIFLKGSYEGAAEQEQEAAFHNNLELLSKEG